MLGFEAVQTGLILLALAIGSFVASGLAGAFSGRFSPVWIVRAGLVAEIIGVTAVGVRHRSGCLVGAAHPRSLRLRARRGPGHRAAHRRRARRRPGRPRAVRHRAPSRPSRQLGAALGIAILGTILFSSTAAVFSASLDDRGIPSDQRDQVVSAVVDSAGGAIAGLEQSPQTEALAEDAKAALSQGTKYASFAAAGFLVLGLLATLSLGSGSRPRDPDAEADALRAVPELRES